MDKQEFSTKLSISKGKGRLPIPFDPRETWGERPRYHVRGTINGIMWRGPLSVDEQGYYLSLGPAWVRDANIEVNAPVRVELALEGPHQESLAEDIAAALATDEEARTFFIGLATFYRKGYVNWIEGAKRPETRASRIVEMMALLKARQKQR